MSPSFLRKLGSSYSKRKASRKADKPSGFGRRLLIREGNLVRPRGPWFQVDTPFLRSKFGGLKWPFRDSDSALPLHRTPEDRHGLLRRRGQPGPLVEDKPPRSDRVKIVWKFDRKAAHRKFGYKTQSSKRSKTQMSRDREIGRASCRERV